MLSKETATRSRSGTSKKVFPGTSSFNFAALLVSEAEILKLENEIVSPGLCCALSLSDNVESLDCVI